MAGYPYSGKTYTVERLDKALGGECLVISPKFLFPPNYDELDEQEKTEVNIVSWRCSLDQLETSFDIDTKEVLIYDTCCSSYESMVPYFTGAKVKGHTVIFLYVHAPLELCKERAGKDWFDADVIEKYKSNFKSNLPLFIKISDKWFKIDNRKEPNLEEVLEYVRSIWNGKI